MTGVYSRFESTGMGLLGQYAEIKSLVDKNVHETIGVFSSNNYGALSCATATNGKLKSMLYVFVKHTETKLNIRTRIIELLKDIRPEFDFAADKNFMPDSFDVVALVAAIQREFGISIKGRDITPENFSSLDSITALLERYGVGDEI